MIAPFGGGFASYDYIVLKNENGQLAGLPVIEKFVTCKRHTRSVDAMCAVHKRQQTHISVLNALSDIFELHHLARIFS